MLPNFVAKVTIDRRACLQLNGKLVLEEFPMLRAGLIAAANRDAAALFAEPVLTAKGDQIEVAWYSEQAGEPTPLDGLDPDVRRIVADKLKARLASLAPLLGSDLGPLLARALYVIDPADILAVGQEPLLIRWGVLPDGLAATDEAGLDRHFAATLGRFAAFGPPRIAVRPISPQTPPAPVGRPNLSIAGPAVDRPAASLAAGRGLIYATVTAAVVALLLTLPGVLATPAAAPADDDAALARARDITKAMRDKVDQARAALAGVNCNPDGSITPPGSDDPGQLPPQPIPIRQDPSRPQGDMSLVARRATESVVLIFTCVERQAWTEEHKDDKEKMTPYHCPAADGTGAKPAAGGQEASDLVVDVHGSGFFIGPGRIATNSHVVNGAKMVFVTNRFLGRLARAKVEAATVKEHQADPDFAVVSVDVERSPPPIELATSASRLQNVVAAGVSGRHHQRGCPARPALQRRRRSGAGADDLPGVRHADDGSEQGRAADLQLGRHRPWQQRRPAARFVRSRHRGQHPRLERHRHRQRLQDQCGRRLKSALRLPRRAQDRPQDGRHDLRPGSPGRQRALVARPAPPPDRPRGRTPDGPVGRP